LSDNWVTDLILLLLHALHELLRTTPLNRLPCYGALEVIVTLLLLLFLTLGRHIPEGFEKKIVIIIIRDFL